MLENQLKEVLIKNLNYLANTPQNRIGYTFDTYIVDVMNAQYASLISDIFVILKY
jgi:hypothetical protein